MKSSWQFEREYAKRDNKSVFTLRRYRTVRPCHCGDDWCEGWQSINYWSARVDASWRRWSHWWLVIDAWRKVTSWFVR